MSFWNRRNVFITGATGLLGSWLIEELLNRGASVTCLLRDWVPGSVFVQSHLLARTNVVRGELEDYSVIVRALNEYEIDSVFHLGAQTIVGTAGRSPLSTFESNIRGTWNLMESCRICSNRIERVLVASSDKAYGAANHLPYTEETPLLGRFPYDVSKSCADLISLSYFHTYRTPVAVTRCGNLFGGGDLNFNRLVPGTIRSALENKPPVIRSNGRLVRDYFYVRDAVEAYLLLAEKVPQEDITGQAFNFGNSSALSVMEVVQKILELSEKTYLIPLVLDNATMEIPYQSLDCTKAHRILNWRPKFNLEDALRETIAWYREWLKGETPAGSRNQ